MVDSLSTLLSRSWSFYKANFVAILCAALVMGAVLLLIQVSMARQVVGGLGQMGLDPARLEELQRRVAAGDQEAAQQMQQEVTQALGKLGQNGDEAAAAAAGSVAAGMVGALAKTLLISVLVSFLLGVLFNGYVLLLVLERQTPQATFSKLLTLFLPLVGLSIWVALRTFIWIPLIGIVTAIVLGPRFVLAPIFLVRDRKGVMESASLSYARTQGSWGKIVGNVIVAAICAWLVSIVLGFILKIVLGGAMTYVAPFLSSLTTGFTIVFVAFLGLALLQQQGAAPAPVGSVPPAAPVS